MRLHDRLLLDTQRALPPAPPNNEARSDHLGYTKEANFDTNMVIILAALLCALIFALGLNSIVRCALRCSRRMAFESPDSTVARLAVNGLKKSKLREIPVSVYGSGVTDIPGTECPICLGEFIDGEKIRVLPRCHHGFHVRCIDIWLASHSSCPTCRQSLLEQPPSLAEEGFIGFGGGIRQQQQQPGNGPAGHGDVPGYDEEVG